MTGSRDLLLIFWDPLHIWERLELETSNLASRLITMGTNERKAKLGQRGSGRGYVTYFCNFGTPFPSYFWNFRDPVHISGMVGARNVKFGMQIY